MRKEKGEKYEREEEQRGRWVPPTSHRLHPCRLGILILSFSYPNQQSWSPYCVQILPPLRSIIFLSPTLMDLCQERHQGRQKGLLGSFVGRCFACRARKNRGTYYRACASKVFPCFHRWVNFAHLGWYRSKARKPSMVSSWKTRQSPLLGVVAHRLIVKKRDNPPNDTILRPLPPPAFLLLVFFHRGSGSRSQATVGEIPEIFRPTTLPCLTGRKVVPLSLFSPPAVSS
jgi:hypothetical protein